jgi:hypothetical protein
MEHVYLTDSALANLRIQEIIVGLEDVLIIAIKMVRKLTNIKNIYLYLIINIL